MKERPNLDSLSVLDEKGSRQYVYPADVKGFFTQLKSIFYFILMAVYLILPWINVQGKPAILLDIAHRHFYIFGKTFNAQDFYLVFFLLTGAAFVLMVLSTVFGRVWCGFLCPQTVFVDGLFRRVERWLEGDRSTRLRLRNSPWTAQKIAKKLSKHIIFFIMASVLAHAFLAYFYSHDELIAMVKEGPVSHMRPFLWATVLTGLIYFDCFWFREQFCIVMCPYGRFQSALQDEDTFHVAYDSLRGEKRGKVGTAEAGDCVDCGRCIAVCPTGIDIRNGMQLECIGCANCIDACNEIMGKLSRPKNLIRYDSLHGLSGQKRRLWRPRVYAYLVAGLIGLTALSFAFFNHRTFEANLLRTRNAPFILQKGILQNQAVLHLINKSSSPCTLRITADTQRASVFLPVHEIRLESLQSYQLPLVVSIKKEDWPETKSIQLQVLDVENQEVRIIPLRIMGPNNQ